MFNTIIQLSRIPIEKENYIKEKKYYTDLNFVGEVADYVEETGWNSAIEMFREFLKGIAVFDGDMFMIINKEKYFEQKYKSFKELVSALNNTSLEDFSTYLSCTAMYMRQLQENYDRAFDFYIDDDGESLGLVTLDTFMRHAENGQKYYIGNTIGYHI